MNPVESILTLMEQPVSAEDKARIERAYHFAADAHRDQKRKSGEPYVTHVVAAAKNCALLGMDIETIVGALLHDVLEDTAIAPQEIKTAFGENVLFLVEGVTKLGRVKYRGEVRHVESMRKFFIAMAEDIRVLIIKLADRLHNVETLEHVPEEKRKRIALETIEVHASLAGRLGMGKLKGILEDHAFKYAYPKEYERTTAIFKERAPLAKQAVNNAHTAVEKTLTEYKIEAAVESRIKHTYSLYRKLVKYEWNVEKVYDIIALRVLVASVADCYQVLGLIHMLWKPIPGRIKDYIALPKHNSYQSLHTTVITESGIIEIQIRTHEMHEVAEMGIAAHFMYKEKTTTTAPLDWLDEIKELHGIIKNPSTFLKHLHLDLFRNRIFVFTPKGDVIDLPEGAVPIDFAYLIHSALGEKTSAAKINGKLVALHTKLKNGDVVEIITGKNAKPSGKWLDFAKTTAARKKIRAYIAEHGSFIDRFFSRNQ
ncbi:MAG TPA: RelA/SpoT family protein [Candidatus Paceibacterota bacterium]|nr:RelA/SpoT family protein [Candidatus Paceibacterota bacterium]